MSGGDRAVADASPSRPPCIAVVLVGAVAENGVIGRAGTMPWRLKSDMRHFRALTWNKPVVMGRKTYEAIGKPLAGRTNIVVTRDRNFTAPGILVAAALEPALHAARGDALRRGAGAIAIIGGGDIYAQTLPLADRLALTLIKARPDGDVRFPPIDPKVWHEIERREQPAGPDDSAAFAFVTYGRAEPPA